MEYIEAQTFTVTVWDEESEGNFTYGPFNTEAEADNFSAYVARTYGKKTVAVTLVNPPIFVGTGREERFEQES